jgi:hypothetical protein
MPDWSQGAQGAAGGAMAGAGIAGPWGAAAGGAIGGLMGLLGGNPQAERAAEYEKMLKQLAAGYGAREAPQMGPAAQAGNSTLMSNRAGLVAQLEAQARGEGPSAAQGQMREAMDRAAAGQASAAAGAGGRGVNAGAALRGATNNTAAIQSQGARDTSILRAQEQIAATQQLGGVIGQGIGQDNQLAMGNAGMQNDVGMANLQAAMQTLGLNQQGELQALIAAMSGGGAGMGGPMGTSIMAGGASMLPAMLQMNQQRKMAQAGAPGTATPAPATPTGTPSPTSYGNGAIGSGRYGWT